MSLDESVVRANYESAIFSLAHGLPPEDLYEAMQIYALKDELEVAQGIREAIADFLHAHGKQNCKVKPIVLQEEWYGEGDLPEGYIDEGYEDIDED